MIFLISCGLFSLPPKPSTVPAKQVSKASGFLFSSENESYYLKSGTLSAYDKNGKLTMTWHDVGKAALSPDGYLIFWANDLHALLCFRAGRLVWYWTDSKIKNIPEVAAITHASVILRAGGRVICVRRGQEIWRVPGNFLSSYGDRILISNKSGIICMHATENTVLWSINVQFDKARVVMDKIHLERRGKVMRIGIMDGILVTKDKGAV